LLLVTLIFTFHLSPEYIVQKGRVFMITDFGPNPFVTDINKATINNQNYRTALWTGKHLQATLMSIGVGDDVGLEIHPDTDQFFRVEEGQGLAVMGNSKENLYYRQPVYDDMAIFIPANTWHNVINTGNKPLKMYSIYAPPHHPRGTVEKTKAIAEENEKRHG
jgi:mannose-6-phosphate isomerase-like protein (cupin superfamily)